ncbi:MAG TPA: sigma-70 family RNA polymerase sigma factor [Chitinophagales bacterium]|nr:sigma-70 family RNA polymerase sigma factor [Chitinophagales bacterium]
MFALFLRSSKRTHESDGELVQKYRNSGDLVYIGELYQRYTHLVFGVCMKYLHNVEESKDAAMEVFEKIMQELKRHEVENFKPWLYFVARNHCLMKLRRQSSLYEHKAGFTRFYKDFMEFEDLSHLLNGKADEEQVMEFLRNGIEELKEEQRHCIVLFYFENKSYEEIAQHTGYSMMQVKSFLQNGKRNLKIYMQHRYGK